MIDVLSWLLFAAFVIVIGYLGQVLFKKTGVADIVPLMLIGLAIGPVFALIDIPTISFFKAIAPLFASLTLLLLLFEGGMRLNFHRVVREFGFALGFTLISFVLTLALVNILYRWTTPQTGILSGVLLVGLITFRNHFTVRSETNFDLGQIMAMLTDDERRQLYNNMLEAAK